MFNKKTICAAAVIALLCATSLQAQNEEKRFGLGFYGGIREYKGDITNQWFKFKPNVTYGLSLSRYLNRSFDLSLAGNYGKMSMQADSIPMSPLSPYKVTGNLLDVGFELAYKFNNGKILKENALIAPFLTAGLGALYTKGFEKQGTYKFANYPANTPISQNLDFNLALGLGFKIRLSNSASLVLRSTAHLTQWDELDGIFNNVKGNKYDKWLHHSAGIVFNLGKSTPRDDDNDGVINKLDKCKTTRAGYKVDATGCDLDSDKDGVVDNEDKCPDVAGLTAFEGCPDSDKDGVEDSKDKCPTVAGLEKFAGCPDTDKDGVADNEDKCPTVAGETKFAGCPDTDKDGVEDSKDKCPKEAGLAKLSGCPDTDGDGVENAKDKCPTEVGTIANNGCPEMKEEVKAQIALAAKGIFFESAKDIIKKESIDDLDLLVKILKEYNTSVAEINGHTDNAGKPEKNLELSQRRANAVQAYLVSKGIDASRLAAKGYGDTMPVADNKTPAGKAQNRRVEFKISYK